MCGQGSIEFEALVHSHLPESECRTQYSCLRNRPNYVPCCGVLIVRILLFRALYSATPFIDLKIGALRALVAGLAENWRGREATIAGPSLGFSFAGFRAYPKIQSCTEISSVSRRELHVLGVTQISG